MSLVSLPSLKEETRRSNLALTMWPKHEQRPIVFVQISPKISPFRIRTIYKQQLFTATAALYLFFFSNCFFNGFEILEVHQYRAVIAGGKTAGIKFIAMLAYPGFQHRSYTCIERCPVWTWCIHSRLCEAWAQIENKRFFSLSRFHSSPRPICREIALSFAIAHSSQWRMERTEGKVYAAKIYRRSCCASR